jgi:parvulin-like peptidyl-prolyl isomerase
MLLFMGLLYTLAACDQEPREDVVAVVGKRQITAADLHKFVLELLPGLRSDKEGQQAREDYLQTLIDRQVLLLEAYRLELDKDPHLLKILKGKKQDRIVAIFLKREVRPQIAVSEEEIHRFFAEQGMRRERLLSGIVVQTEDGARQILEQLHQGHSFAALARARSLDTGSAERGGEVGFVNRPRSARLGIPAAVFDSLQTGVVSAPLVRGENYQLVHFTEDRLADLDIYRAKIVQQLMAEKSQDIKTQKVELLAYELGWRMAPEGLALLSKGAQSLEPFTKEQRRVALFTYEGGAISLDEYIEVLHAHRIDNPKAFQDSAFIASVARRYVLTPTMFGVAAARLGIPQEPEVRQWIETAKEELLLLQLRQREVSATISPSAEQVRQLYEENLEKFRLPELICFDELLTDSEKEAQKLRAEIDKDTNLLELARAKNLPTRRRGADGLVCMNTHHKAAYPQLWEALKAAPIGALSGPVAAGEGYVIFKILRRQQARQQPFEQARKRARASLVQRLERQRFDEWLGTLRQQYQDQIEIYADHLEEALPEVLLAGSAEAL